MRSEGRLLGVGSGGKAGNPTSCSGLECDQPRPRPGKSHYATTRTEKLLMRGKKLSIGLRVTLAIVALPLLAASAYAATENVLYSFQNNGQDGEVPVSSLIFDKAGNLYGTTYQGGAYNFGTVFELTPASGGGWTETVLHTFGSGTDGGAPYGGLIFDASGNLYGTTQVGGADGYGTVFE